MNNSNQLSKMAEQAAKLMSTVVGIVTRDDQFKSKDLEITLYQLRFLKALFANGESSMRQLSEQLYVSPSSATVIVDRLVKHGLVFRKDDPGDRRFVKVGLSQKGQEIIRQFEQARKKRWSDILKNLDPDDRNKFLELFQQWLSLLQKSEARRMVGV